MQEAHVNQLQVLKAHIKRKELLRLVQLLQWNNLDHPCGNTGVHTNKHTRVHNINNGTNAWPHYELVRSTKSTKTKQTKSCKMVYKPGLVPVEANTTPRLLFKPSIPIQSQHKENRCTGQRCILKITPVLKTCFRKRHAFSPKTLRCPNALGRDNVDIQTEETSVTHRHKGAGQ